MKRMAAVASAAASRVCFLTDVEGNWSYVRNFVRASQCLRFRDAAERELALRDDCVLVFGGDAGDKGDDTLHCYEQLVRLKREHPDRVVLLVGNRDVNKMRFTSELHDSEMDLRTMATEIRDGPVWVPEEKRTTLTAFLTKKTGDAAVSEANPTCDASGEAEPLAAVNTKANRLDWMLEHTMGSQGDFERRRKELLARTRVSGGVSDDDVVQSFAASVDDGGVLREFLLEGKLAFIIHKTLFVHGGIITRQGNAVVSTLGRVPGDAHVYEDVYEWVEKLNAWYREQLREWLAQPTWTQERSTRGGHELLAYVLPDYMHSVVMGRHLDSAGMPVPLPQEDVKRLEASGITRVIVGHTPHGTCPTVVRQPSSAESFREVIMCDTSYSDMTAPDNRGAAASELLLHADGRVDIHGALENGRRIAYSTDTTGSSVVGRLLNDGMRVKAQLADETEQYLVFKVENGYSYTYVYRSLVELQEIGFADEA